jgi:hypothetical protein
MRRTSPFRPTVHARQLRFWEVHAEWFVASLTAVKFDRDVCIELCTNGPDVPVAVDKLMRRSERYIEASEDPEGAAQ